MKNSKKEYINKWLDHNEVYNLLYSNDKELNDKISETIDNLNTLIFQVAEKKYK